MGRRFVQFYLYLYRLRAPLYQGDIEMAVIGDVVGLHALGIRHDQVSSAPTEGCTLASIASATGLARETVRRKTRRLIDHGYVIEAEGKGFSLAPGILQTEPYWGAIGELDSSILTLANGFLANGEFVLAPVGAGDVSAAASALRLKPTAGPERWRALLRVFANFYVRMYRLRVPPHRNDLEMAIIFDMVGILVIDHLMEEGPYRKTLSSLSLVLGEAQRACNVQRLVAGTGLPRETVRRKLKSLVEDGYLVHHEDGFIHRPGQLQSPAIWHVVSQIESHLLDFLNDCLETGLYEVGGETD